MLLVNTDFNIKHIDLTVVMMTQRLLLQSMCLK